jgi:hypothetical protein
MFGFFKRKNQALPRSDKTEGRVFADYFQIHLRDGESAEFDVKTENWTDEDTKAGFAGNEHYRMFSTVSQFQDHWITMRQSETQPDVSAYDRIISFRFSCDTGFAMLWETCGSEAELWMHINPGPYTVFVCSHNPGAEPLPMGDNMEWPELSDDELRNRTDLERFVIVFVPEDARS